MTSLPSYALRFTYFVRWRLVLWFCSNIDYFSFFLATRRSRLKQIFIIIIEIILRQWCGIRRCRLVFFFSLYTIICGQLSEGVLVCIDTFKLRLYNFRAVHPQFWPVFFCFIFFYSPSPSLLCYLQLVIKLFMINRLRHAYKQFTLWTEQNLRPIHVFNNKENNVINKLVAEVLYVVYALSRWDITFISRN